MLYLLAALAVPVVVATLLLSRKRTYRPAYRPGGPLPQRQPKADRVFTVDRTASTDRTPRAT